MNKTKSIKLILALLFHSALFSQVGIGTVTPNADSILDLDSNNKGLMLPRVAAADRPAANAVNKGMFIFNLTTGAIEYCDGTVWISSLSFPTIYNANGTIGSGRLVAITDNINFDSNTFYIDGTNNRIGLGTAAPNTRLEITSGITNASGVRLTNLIAGSGTVSTGEPIGVDAVGNIIKVASSNSNFSSKVPLTITGTAANPTKAAVKQNDFIRYRDLGNNEIEVDFMYSAKSAAGAAAGTGDYLFTLPGGLSFNLTEQPAYTAIPPTAEDTFVYSVGRTRSANWFVNSYNSAAYIVPYNATQFRIITTEGTGSGYPRAIQSSYGIDYPNNAYGGRFKFVKQ
ncbi:hypothetical protein ASE21_15155 [Flavobacterium sp. Root901]|uniref:hypothetical protein n=1 Tax=Flavobacterium sp. Root901 TaxID=1736605 RepID=UPI0007095174|nr:hypothetical protein [Flavobacterium sp. Root901]KRD09177.1 hypothetical protein ASE21_15155 [Flavobacterium sp. Root901]